MKGAKFAAKAASSASAKAEYERQTTSEMAQCLADARAGSSNAQCRLALYYAENGDLGSAYPWLIKSARQGNEYALPILDMWQDED